MVLEAFAALGLAANIVQFLDFGSKLITSTTEIYRTGDGLTKEHVHLEQITLSLRELSAGLTLRKTNARLSVQEHELYSLAEECNTDADHLLHVLGRIKEKAANPEPEGPAEDNLNTKKVKPITKWQSFRHVLKAKWKEREIKDLEKRLNEYRSQLSILIVTILNDRNSVSLRTIQDIGEENARMNIDRTNQLQEINDNVLHLQHLHSHWVQKSDFPGLHKTLSDIISSSSDVLKEQSVVSSLKFQQIKVRYSAISEAHTKTFAWIFHRRADRNLKFRQWLEMQKLGSSAGIYWIAGKPGSGKSTLMKFIHDHTQTLRSLRIWAGSNSLVMCGFFFWHAGTPLQKSQDGLLRTLLFEIFRKCPHLISEVVPDRYHSASQDEWARKDLLQAFQNLKEKFHTSTRFCFFVDGLDEYNGDPRDILDVLTELSKSNCVKICVSSRPWPIFKQAFDHYVERRVYLQDLTYDDITIYVRDKLEQDPVFRSAKTEDERYQELVTEIVFRAQGVFLWVFLVVRSLLDGLTNADSLRTLQVRLRRLPTDLEEFFSHILDSVDKLYHVQMTRTFQIMLTANSPLPLILCSMIDELEEDPNFALKLDIDCRDKFTKRSLTSREAQMRKRIDARTKGLLEVTADLELPVQWLSLKVDFLHRTVGDFLKQKDIQERFANPGSSFDPNFAIANGILAVFKAVPLGWSGLPTNIMNGLIRDFLDHVYICESRGEISIDDTINNLEETLVSIYPAHSSRSSDYPVSQRRLWLDSRLLKEYGARTLFEMCTQRGLSRYVSKRFDNDPSLVCVNWHYPLLLHAIFPKAYEADMDDPTDTVQVLLENGFDPNKEYGTSTVWSSFGQRYGKIERDNKGEGENLHIQDARRHLFRLFLDHGADASEPNLLYDILCCQSAHLRTRQQRANRLQILMVILGSDYINLDTDLNKDVWERRLTQLYEEKHKISVYHYTEIKQENYREVELLLHAGADTDVQISSDSDSIRLDDVIQVIFQPDQAVELLQLVEQKRTEKQRQDHAEKGIIARFQRWLGPGM